MFQCTAPFLCLSMSSFLPSFLLSFSFLLQRRRLQTRAARWCVEGSTVSKWRSVLFAQRPSFALEDAWFVRWAAVPPNTFVSNWTPSEKQVAFTCHLLPPFCTLQLLLFPRSPPYKERSWWWWLVQVQKLRRGWNITVTWASHVSPQSSAEWGTGRMVTSRTDELCPSWIVQSQSVFGDHSLSS